MAQINSVQQVVYDTICFIGAREAEMESLRQELNLQIAFNLKDTYLAIAKDQISISMKNLGFFLGIEEERVSSLERCIRWNSHNNSLNLSFAEFSALLVSKEDRLLAKMVIERQAMGAIPNFLLLMVKKILNIEFSIHEYCGQTDIEDENELIDWLERVTDENGDLDPDQLNSFIQSKAVSVFDDKSHLFVRYLRLTGNITAERLRSLWLQNGRNQKNEQSSVQFKSNKISTYITCPASPKSLFSIKSQKELPRMRPEYFDCLNRPVFSEDNDLRNKKSIEKHLNRIDSAHKLKLLSKIDQKNTQYLQNLRIILNKLKEIIEIERKTQELRVELCMCPDFYPILFFDTIPKEKKGTLLASNFKDYLEQFGYCIDLSLIYYLFRRYSKQAGKLTFNGFCSIFDVSESSYNLIEKNRFVQSLTDIDVTTKKLFFQLLIEASKNEQKINDIKVQLLKECSNTTETVDKLFRQYPQGLSEQALKALFKKHFFIQLPRRDIKLFWKKLNLNLRNQQSIQKGHLLSQLTPFNIGRKNKQF